MQYITFIDSHQFDQGSLDAHLAYLRRDSMATPDCWDSCEDLAEITNEAKDWAEEHKSRAVVTDEDYKVLFTHDCRRHCRECSKLCAALYEDHRMPPITTTPCLCRDCSIVTLEDTSQDAESQSEWVRGKLEELQGAPQ